ncbi:MAG: hypothetical protein GEV28_21510 [Actinophytocola sp.]|uniref:hypothetical protein n=1 Tax=Actinophytocola sp. TaxID=1872138 RepID=UPI001329DCE7|nr:hypothetical protein [Actinophytocola sp.]MPZ82833.1 hypothetical protein [Actinophytocola sp.]
MKRLGTVVGAGVLLLLASACANPQENQDNAGDSRPTETSAPADTEPDKQPARTPPSGGEKVSAGQIDATALPKGFPVMVWTEGDGRTVGVVAQEGGCGKASVEVPTQSDSEVVLTMIETVPKDPKPCTMDLRYPKLTTELDQPLADRKLVLKNVQRKS